MAGYYAVVIGEALIDLAEAEFGGERAYRPLIGGAPLNVAVGLARLGVRAELVTALGTDVFGQRIRTFLAETGVGTTGCVSTDVPTTLAVASFRGAEPEFTFYGNPPSYAQVRPADLDAALVAQAAVLYCGSIALLDPQGLATARHAWAQPGPLRTLDPNVRPALLRDVAGLRAVIEEFASGSDLVKLSEPDAYELFALDPAAAAGHLRDLGAGVVVVTRGPRGALLAVGDARIEVPAPAVDLVDTTGAGDAVMAGLLTGLVRGAPTHPDGWRELVEFALRVAARCCERPGGATAMPTLAEV